MGASPPLDCCERSASPSRGRAVQHGRAVVRARALQRTGDHRWWSQDEVLAVIGSTRRLGPGLEGALFASGLKENR